MRHSLNNKPSKVITNNYLRNFLVLLLLVILVGTAISAAALYFNIHRPLNTHYSAIITIITDIKESLIIRTLKINLVFIFLIAAGVGLLSLLYTHRIAGPLFRIKTSAKAIAEGRLDTVIKLRQKDAISSFADTINEMTGSYSNRVSGLTNELQDLKATLAEYQSLINEGKENETTLKKINDIDKRIKELLNDINFDKKVSEASAFDGSSET